MANFFDQFEGDVAEPDVTSPPEPIAAPDRTAPPEKPGNFFDQFDEPKKTANYFDQFDKKPEPEKSGVLSTFGQSALRGVVEAGKDIAGSVHPFDESHREKDETEIGKLLAKPISEGWRDPNWWAAFLGHSAGEMSPALALGAIGGIGGGVAGTAVAGPPGAAVGALGGAAAGFGLASALQTIKPAYIKARDDGLDHDAAVSRAMTETGIAGAFGAVMGAVPGASIFGRQLSKTASGTLTAEMKRPISEALAQIFGVQPAIGAAQQEAVGLVEGRQPTAEEFLQGYVGNVIPGAGMVGAHAAGRRLLRGKPGEETPPGQEQPPAQEPAQPPGGDVPPPPPPGAEGRAAAVEKFVRDQLTPDQQQTALPPREEQKALPPPGEKPIEEARVEAPPEPPVDDSAAAEVAAHVDEHDARVNPDPSDAEVAAGNYDKGHPTIPELGHEVSTETASGGVRRSRDPNVPWEARLPEDTSYGQILRTKGADGQPIDIFIGPDPGNGQAWIVDQRNPDTGAFDEHKVMVGFRSQEEALDRYAASYSDSRGMDRVQDIRSLTMPELRGWLKDGDHTTAYSDQVPFEGERLKPADFAPLRARMASVVGDKAALQFVERLQGGIADGSFDKDPVMGRIIKLAQDQSAANAKMALDHEMVHALEDIGVFQPEEWQVLVDEANHRADAALDRQYIEQYAADAKANGKPLDPAALQKRIISERVAHMLTDLINGKPPEGALGKVTERLGEFIRALGNWMRGFGYRTAKDIAKQVDSGAMKERADNTLDKTKTDNTLRAADELGGHFAGPETNMDDSFRQFADKLGVKDGPAINHVAALWTIDRGKDTGFEHAVITTMDGKFLAATTNHDTSSVRTPTSLDQTLLVPGLNLVLHHNHPLPVPLSDADVIGGLALAGGSWTIAYLPDGSMSGARIDPTFAQHLYDVAVKSKELDKLDEWRSGGANLMYGNARKGVLKVLYPDFAANKISGEVMDQVGQEAALRALEAAGVIEYVSTMDHRGLIPDDRFAAAVREGIRQVRVVANYNKIKLGAGYDTSTIRRPDASGVVGTGRFLDRMAGEARNAPGEGSPEPTGQGRNPVGEGASRQGEAGADSAKAVSGPLYALRTAKDLASDLSASLRDPANKDEVGENFRRLRAGLGAVGEPIARFFPGAAQTFREMSEYLDRVGPGGVQMPVLDRYLKRLDEAVKNMESESDRVSPLYALRRHEPLTRKGKPDGDAEFEKEQREKGLAYAADRRANPDPLLFPWKDVISTREPVVPPQPKDETAPTFYSQFQRQIEERAPGKQAPQAWLGYIQNLKTKGVKQTEVEWSGVEDWLKSRKGEKGSIPKDEILEFLRKNSPDIHETYNGPAPNRSVDEVAPRPFDQRIWDDINDWLEKNEPGKSYIQTNLLHDLIGEDYPSRSDVHDAILWLNHVRVPHELTDRLHDENDRIDGYEPGVRSREEDDHDEVDRNFPSGTTVHPIKYGDWVLPGGENNREFVFTIPRREPAAAEILEEAKKFWNHDMPGVPFSKANSAETEHYLHQAKANLISNQPTYTHSHWGGIDNPIAHIRTQDRIGSEGYKLFHIDEIQSDWHKVGRKEGYKRPIRSVETTLDQDFAERLAADSEAGRSNTADTDEIDRIIANENALDRDITEAAHKQGVPQDLILMRDSRSAAQRDGYVEYPWAVVQKRFHRGADAGGVTRALGNTPDEAIRNFYADNPRTEGAVPDAPFKGDSWKEVALKRAIRYAAENGYDGISWSPGHVHADRYDLRKYLDRIEYDPEEERLYAYDDSGNEVVSKRIRNRDPETFEKELAENIGDGLAKDLVRQVRDFEDSKPEYEIREVLHDDDGNVVEQGNPNALDGHTEYQVWHEGADDPIYTSREYRAAENEMEGLLAEHARENRPRIGYAALEIGGEKHLKNYDEIIPKVVRNIVKKWNGKIEYTEIDTPDYVPRKDYDDEPQDSVSVPMVRITPEMRESVLKEGQPLWALRRKTEAEIADAETKRQERNGKIMRALKAPFRAMMATPQFVRLMQGETYTTLDSAFRAFDRNFRMFLSPMTVGTDTARAEAKTFADERRALNLKYARLDQMLTRIYKPDERAAMGKALDEESVEMQREAFDPNYERDPSKGLVNLTADQRATVETLNNLSKQVWQRMFDAGIVRAVDGLPSYMPRMFVSLAEGRFQHAFLNKEGTSALDPYTGISTSGPRGRKHLTPEESEMAAKLHGGENVSLVTDVRALLLALSRGENAVAGRQLINSIRKLSDSAGMAAVGDSPEGGKFTIDHPAFQEWAPKLEKDENGKWGAVKDEEGNVIFQQRPIYVSRDFEGPLRAVLTKPAGATYRALLDIKQAGVQLVMISPMIHNAVEFGRAFPLLPGKMWNFKVYWEGNAAKKNDDYMVDAVRHGLVPIGSGGHLPDITEIANEPGAGPGRSILTRAAGNIIGAVGGERANMATRRGLDSLGQLLHGTLLWDRIADLQVGLYKNLSERYMAEGYSETAAKTLAAFQANRYAGALPQEAMGDTARKIANIALFSRTFTLGNLGAMKDMFKGLPMAEQAKLAKDIGLLQAQAASSKARAKAVSAFVIDLALFYGGVAVAQEIGRYMRDEETGDEVLEGFKRRWQAMTNRVAEHPLDVLNPFDIAESLLPQGENEPGKEARVYIGRDPSGRAWYARNIFGKIGEEFAGWLTSPVEMLRRKTSTLVHPIVDTYKNADEFGHHIYDTEDKTAIGMAKAAGNVVAHFMKAQLPLSTIKGVHDLATGAPNTGLTVAQTALPLAAGITLSRGYPGGPEEGVVAAERRRRNDDLVDARAEAKELVARGKNAEAFQTLIKAKMTPQQAKSAIMTMAAPARNLPRDLKTFSRTATPEELERLRNVTR